MRKIIYPLLVLAGISSGVALAAGMGSPPPVATPALDSWGLLGLAFLVPVIAALAYKNKK